MRYHQVGRLGFYSKNRVYPLVPKILLVQDDVEMVVGKYDGELGKLVEQIVTKSARLRDERYKVFLLSAPDSPDTLKLSAPIPNDIKSQAGRRTAFTMGQRYVASSQLLLAKTTSDLE